MNLLSKFSVWGIREIHQKRLSSKLNKRGQKCRFYPTCSEYTILSIKKHGFIMGWIKGICRILRCVPTNHDSCIDFP